MATTKKTVPSLISVREATTDFHSYDHEHGVREVSIDATRVIQIEDYPLTHFLFDDNGYVKKQPRAGYPDEFEAATAVVPGAQITFSNEETLRVLGSREEIERTVNDAIRRSNSFPTADEIGQAVAHYLAEVLK